MTQGAGPGWLEPPGAGWAAPTGRAGTAQSGDAGWVESSGPAGTARSGGTGWVEPPAGPDPGGGAAARGRRAARDRGRFTRNFVVQASAADWALVLLAAVRRRLAGQAAQLVFFQHDEVVIHCPRADAELVAGEVREAAAESGRLVFGDTPVRFPLSVAVVDCYADAK